MFPRVSEGGSQVVHELNYELIKAIDDICMSVKQHVQPVDEILRLADGVFTCDLFDVLKAIPSMFLPITNEISQ